MAVSTPVNTGYTIINGTTTGSNGSKVNTWVEYKVTSQSVANNTSTIRVVLYSQATWDSGTAHEVTKEYGYVNIDSSQQKYSMTGGYDFGNKKLNKFADHTFTVTHGTDGKKTVTIGGAWSDNWSSYISGGSASASVTLPQIARASTISNLSTTLGTAGTITITRQDTSFRHTLQYSFDNSNWTNIATGIVAGSYSWTPSVDLISSFSNSKTKTGYLRCITYTSGNVQVGTKTSTLTLTAPSSSLSNVTGTYGTALTLTATNACSSGLTYTFQYYNGSAWTSIASGVTGKTRSWTPATSLIANVDNASTGTISIRVITYVGTATVNTASATATLTIPKNTSSARSGTIGNALSIPITKAHSKLTSTITYSFGSKSNVIIVEKTTSTSYSWTPSTSLLTEIPSATSGVGTIKIESFNGTKSLGSNTYELTLAVANNVVPTVSFDAPVRVNNNATVESWGIYLQGYSTVKIKLRANGVSGSTISRMSITGQGISSASTPGTSSAYLETTSSIFGAAGTFSYTGAATDSRGRSASEARSSSIVVQAYSSPSVTNTRIVRCDSDGTENTAGTSLKVTLNSSYTQVGQNAFTAHLEYKSASDTSWTTVTATAIDPSTANIFNLGLSADQNYYTRVRYSDSLSGYQYTTEITIPSDKRIINVNASGEGLAIGGFSTDAGKLQVYYPTDFEGDTLPTINGGMFVKEAGGYNLWNATKLPFTCDLNDILTAGIYYTNTGDGYTISNLPDLYGVGWGAFNLKVERWMNPQSPTVDNNWRGVFQTLTHYDNKIFFRAIYRAGNDSTWAYTPWNNISRLNGGHTSTAQGGSADDYKMQGAYWVASAYVTELPVGSGWYGILTTETPAPNIYKQTFTAYNNGMTWVRIWTNSRWYDWFELQANVGSYNLNGGETITITFQNNACGWWAVRMVNNIRDYFCVDYWASTVGHPVGSTSSLTITKNANSREVTIKNNNSGQTVLLFDGIVHVN